LLTAHCGNRRLEKWSGKAYNPSRSRDFNEQGFVPGLPSWTKTFSRTIGPDNVNVGINFLIELSYNRGFRGFAKFYATAKRPHSLGWPSLS
jgi:hypothetical protein